MILRTRTYLKGLGGFFVVSLVLGGAGAFYYQAALALQLMSALILAVELSGQEWSRVGQGERRLLGLYGLLGLLMLLQMVPLPPSLWSALPGRAGAAQVGRAIGAGGAWHAFSQTPDQGMTALLRLAPPLAAFLAVLRLGVHDRFRAVRLLVVVALCSAVLGVAQFAEGSGDLTVFDTDQQGFGVGLFVNRNHQSLFLELAILLASVPGVVKRDRKGRGGMLPGTLPVLLACWLVLGMGVLATTSRTALTLLVPTLAVAAFIAGMFRIGRKPVMAGAAGIAAGAILVAASPLGEILWKRYTELPENARFSFWVNSWHVALDNGLMGSGFGSFVHEYMALEPLNQVMTLYINHAHDEYLEWLVEGGIPAIVLLVLALASFGAGCVEAWRARDTGRRGALRVAAAFCVVLVLLHSATEFPLRMRAIAVTFGFCLALVFPAREITRPLSFFPAVGRARAIGGLLAGGMVALASISEAASSYLIINPGGSDLRWMVWNAEADHAVALERMAEGRLDEGMAIARHGLAIDRLDAVALRALAYGSDWQSRGADADRLLAVAPGLGWRDDPLELLLVDRAVRRHDLAEALLHLDALGRVSQNDPLFWAAVSQIVQAPGGVGALVGYLRPDTPWRSMFLRFYPQAPGAAVPVYLSVLRGLAARAEPAGIDEVRTALGIFRLQEDYADASQILALTHPDSFLFDSGFEKAEPGRMPRWSPLAVWHDTELGGSTVAISTPSPEWHGQGAMVSGRHSIAGEAFGQMTAAPAGQYHFSAMVMTEMARPAEIAGWQVRCYPRAADAAPVVLPLEWKRVRGRWWRADVDLDLADTCPGQDFEFTLKPDAEGRGGIAVDDVRLIPQGRSARAF